MKRSTLVEYCDLNIIRGGFGKTQIGIQFAESNGDVEEVRRGAIDRFNLRIETKIGRKCFPV